KYKCLRDFRFKEFGIGPLILKLLTRERSTRLLLKLSRRETVADSNVLKST
ncbi:LOW QUALITY PROTEIN: hypothetical protein TorRG33x02_061520, partial [Trema orientale]